MPRKPDPQPQSPLVRVTGTDHCYPLTLSPAEYAALTGTALDNVYEAARHDRLPVPVIRLSPQRLAFSTAATLTLLGLDYEIVTPAPVSGVSA